jgi:hypothetical protein
MDNFAVALLLQLPFVFRRHISLVIGVFWLSRLQFVSAPTIEFVLCKKLAKSCAKLAKIYVKIN